MSHAHELIVRAIRLDTIATTVLGEIARLIRSAQRITDVRYRLIDSQYADAGGHGKNTISPAEAQSRDAGADSLAKRQRCIELNVAQKRSELIAAQSSQHVLLAQAPLDEPRHLTNQIVTGCVAARVVDDLELIQIKIKHRVGGASRAIVPDRHGQARLEFRPVSQPRERVVRGLILELLGQLPLISNVAQHQDDAIALAVAITKRGDALVE